MIPKNTSTRLSQEPLVGVNCSVIRGFLASQALMSSCLCVVVVQHHVQLSAGIGLGDLLQEVEELSLAVPFVALVDHLAGGDLERGEQRGGAVALVVVGRLLRQPHAQRKDRCGRFSAWTWDFSSTHSTTALPGGFRYNPTTSRTLASSSESVENLNVSCRHGLMWYLRQARATVASPRPSCLPSNRDDQCVTPSLTGGSNVAAMIAESSTTFGRPLRRSSSSPAIPCAANRSRHLITVGRETPSSLAVPDVPTPSATASTIRARSTCPAGTERDRLNDSNAARSSALITKID